MSKAALLAAVSSEHLKSVVPTLAAGYTVKVHQKIKEGDKERVQMFEGLVIALNNGKGINGTFTVRKVVDGIGVEKTFPLHAATITKVELVKKGKVRRAKLYYMRELTGKAARMKETWFATGTPAKKDKAAA